MGWLGDFLRNVRGKPPTDWTFVRDLPDPGLNLAGKDFVPDDCYVEFWVESARLEYGRKFFNKFSASIYSSLRLASEGDDRAHSAGIHTPSEDLKSDDRDRVLLVSKRVVPAIPWRGGVVDLELGLFSVNHGDVITPMLKFVTSVASKAGVSVAAAVDPFVPLVTEGLGLLAGQTKETQVEIGLDTSIDLQKSSFYAVIALPQDEVSPAALRIRKDDLKLEYDDGEPVNAGYSVVSIRRVEQNADWGQIPALKQAWAGVQTAVKDRDRAAADERLGALRAVLAVDPNLITRDKHALFAKARAQVDWAFGQDPGKGWTERQLGELESLNLYAA